MLRGRRIHPKLRQELDAAAARDEFLRDVKRGSSVESSGADLFNEKVVKILHQNQQDLGAPLYSLDEMSGTKEASRVSDIDRRSESRIDCLNFHVNAQGRSLLYQYRPGPDSCQTRCLRQRRTAVFRSTAQLTPVDLFLPYPVGAVMRMSFFSRRLLPRQVYDCRRRIALIEEHMERMPRG